MWFDWIFFIPFFIQAGVISFDEFYFHIKRGLPLWERIGHPLDTFSLVLCFCYVIIFPYSKELLAPLFVLAIISCLLVTKDEWVHKEHCEGKEQWLHSILFLNHPLVLISMGRLWMLGEVCKPFLYLQLVFASLFCLYQLIYWNIIWKGNRAFSHRRKKNEHKEFQP